MMLIAVVSVPLLFSNVSAAECGHAELPSCDDLVNTDGAFVTTWVTSTPNETITIPSIDGTTKYGIIWGDGNADNATGDTSHTYRSSGTYTVTIERTFPGINLERNVDSALKLKEITEWGDIRWSTMEGAFYGAANMNVTASDLPDLSNVQNMDRMFAYARSLDTNINSWNVSNVTSMEQTFMSAQKFNSPLNSWDVSNVTNMSGMFANARSFNQDISDWATLNVTDMSSMFLSASSFNQDLNGDIPNWDRLDKWRVADVTDMSNMFNGATSFDQPLDGWRVYNVTDM
ncbi:MAG: BspA family leucine-rich repeat surface protein, partial [Thaumarchaeota archaeon]|nr:BspA family leucine-rich repeat surface protein [Nitrososphaerota archaeon]